MKHNTPTHILWDLGNTLLTVDSFSFARQMGFTDMMLYSLIDHSYPEEICNKALALLAVISTQHRKSCTATACGKPLPPIACAWLSGHITILETELFFKENPLEDYAPHSFFSSKREARLVKKLLQILTTPEAFTSSIRIIENGITLLQECAAQRDEKGRQQNSLYVLSNWDPYSFNTMLKASHLKPLFSFFDRSNMIISGEIGLIKPQREIYSYVFSTYKLDPAQCLLIDDQEENIKGAEETGMQAILLRKNKYEEVRHQLRAYKIIH
jgi:FMN phosphatase YigB (HAD superfamily)